MAKPLSRRAVVIITLAIVLVPVALMIIASATGLAGSQRYPNLHYMVAFGLGATLTVLLSVGLFSLMFMSARGGMDEEANVKQENEADTDVNGSKDGG